MPSPYQTGFTLLELLIALSLSAFIMLILSVGMHIVLKDWERTSHRLEDSLEMELILLQIERALEGAFPHTYLDQNENRNFIFFEGEENQLSWVSTVSPGRQPGLTSWQLKADDEAGTEVRITSAFASNPSEHLQESEPITTLEGFEAHFEYLYVDERIKEDNKWLEEWSAKKRQGLPHAVRLRLAKAEYTLEIIATIKAYRHEKFRPIKP